MRVLVTRPAHEAQRWVDDLRQRGVDAQALPLIRIVPAANAVELDAAWQALASKKAAMFVSANAVRSFFDARPAAAGWPSTTRAWATGPGTAHALADAGIAASFIDAPPADAEQFDSEALWQVVQPQVSGGGQVLIVRGAESADPRSKGRDWLERQIEGAGAVVTTVVAYLRAMPDWNDADHAQALAPPADTVWLFSSSQAVSNLVALLPQQRWQASRAIATHERIAQAARAAGFGVVCVSRPAVDAVVAALESFR